MHARHAYAVLLPFLTALAASAQAPDSSPAPRVLRGWTPSSSVAEDRFRLAQIRGEEDDRGSYLLRSPSSLLPRQAGAYVALLAPRAEATWNSRLPHSLNDGPAWAGKGLTTRTVLGFEAVAGPFRLIVAPELVTQQNAAFDSLLPAAWDSAQRARFTAPWSVGPNAIDLPYRFGEDGTSTVYAGESSLTARAGVLELGVATESQWWGPGLRNAVMLSDNAGGFPHAVVRSARPFQTPLGSMNAVWIGGRLASSSFDTVSTKDRTLSGAALVLSPRRGLSLGASRIVYARADDPSAEDALAVLSRWGAAGDTTVSHPYQQMLSLFGRWVLSDDGAEVYLEWARRDMPTLREMLEEPEHTQGYLLGGQWSRTAGSGAIRLQGEFTYLEKSSTYRARPVGTWYAGRAVPQGYTHRGQVLGAGIGPGASSQWFAADYMAPRWQGGLFINRIRWANDAYYQQGPNRYLAHDVSALGGARAAVCVGPLWLSAQWTAGRRYNFLFQDSARGFLERRDRSVSPVNHTLQIGLSPRR